MVLELTPKDAFDLAAGALFLVLGIFVLAIRRQPIALALAAYAIGSGALYLMRPFLDADLLGAPLLATLAANGAGLVVVAAGELALLFVLARSMDRTRAAWLALILTSGPMLAFIPYQAIVHPETVVIGDAPPWAGWATLVLLTLDGAGISALFVGIAAMAYGLRADQRDAARTLGALAVGVLLLLMTSVQEWRSVARGEDVALLLATLVLFPGSLAIWLVATRGPHGRIARNVVLVGCAFLLPALLLQGEPLEIYRSAGNLAGALLLAYTILGGLVPGLDVKVRFAVGKSTVAAVFILVFFFASEAAQQFFGEQFGSAYVGIAAAGMLVFALAPLQRAAERIAAHAVPVAAPASAPQEPAATNDHEEMYRDAARRALRDARLTREEERHLFRLARGLGISADRAHELLVEAEREAEARAR